MRQEFPFECELCSQQPMEKFGIFEPVNDWLIAYPEKRLIHIHLGQSITEDPISLAESRFQYDWLMSLFKQYPNTTFFYLIDMTLKDDREHMPMEALTQLKKIVTHPQLPAGAAYGLTWGWHLFGTMLNAVGGRVSLEVTREEAEAKYTKWLARSK